MEIKFEHHGVLLRLNQSLPNRCKQHIQKLYILLTLRSTAILKSIVNKSLTQDGAKVRLISALA